MPWCLFFVVYYGFYALVDMVNMVNYCVLVAVLSWPDSNFRAYFEKDIVQVKE